MSATVEDANDHVSKSRGRKRQRQGPPYYCEHPGCGKSFQRSEHLSRHKLNHNPHTIFKCPQASCTKTFVRHDLLIRHVKRHENKLKKSIPLTKAVQDNGSNANNSQLAGFLSSVVANHIPRDDDGISERVGPSKTDNHNMDLGYSQNVHEKAPATEAHNKPNLMYQTSNTNAKTAVLQGAPTTSASELSTSISHAAHQNDHSNSVNTILKQHQTSNDATLTANIPNNLLTDNVAGHPSFINWLFNESSSAANINEDQIKNKPQVKQADMTFLSDLNEFRLNNDQENFFIADGFDPFRSPFNTSPSSNPSVNLDINAPVIPTNFNVKDNNFLQSNSLAEQSDPANTAISPLLSFQQSQGAQISASYVLKENNLYTLTNDQMKTFSALIPELNNLKDFTLIKFQKVLKTYWNFFHPRFPMLHRPTFKSTEAPPLLLLSMMILGAKLFMCVDNVTSEYSERLIEPKLLADTITEPLRWLLFSSPHFQPPAKIWVIQSLLMLEFYEKHCTSRQLHERGHLHHGTTIQLLRRSPTLGGSPTKYSDDDKADNWYKWIEIESMKRATFMCFYIDATDAINLGHQMLIYAHQIQMTMPVDDKLWESNLSDFNKVIKHSERPQQFLLVLKNLMNGKPTNATSFGKKILLAGLSAILFQIQQRDMQLCFGIDKFSNTISNNWRDLLTVAFSIWRNDVGGSCCSSRTAIDNLNSLGNSSQFSTSDTRCKCVTYHIAHVYMSVSHYDIFIVAGAPWRMNVKPTSLEERSFIERRVLDWSKTRHAEISVVQCYLLLFEMLLSPQDSNYEYQYDYLPDADLFFRSYVIGYCLLVIWCYNYVQHGFKKFDMNHPSNKDGFTYLKAIREEFTKKSGGFKLHNWFSQSTGSEFYGDLMKWVNILSSIEGGENMIGLLECIGKKLSTAHYTAVKEVGKLLLFCRDRTNKSTNEIILEDMYT